MHRKMFLNVFPNKPIMTWKYEQKIHLITDLGKYATLPVQLAV